MKNFTLFARGCLSPMVKQLILTGSLIAGLSTMSWSQASLNHSLPVNSKICTGANATFTVSATGAGTLSYRWQESTDGGTSWNDLVENSTTGANTANGIYTGTAGPVLTITHAPSTMNGNKYQSIVYVNGINPVISTQATLNVGPDVSLDPVTSVNCPATSNTLNTAAAAGVGYQWQVSSDGGSNWANVVDGSGPGGVTYTGGATGALLIGSLTNSIDGYQYRYIANDGQGCVITSAATTQQVPELASFTYPSVAATTADIGTSISIPVTITAGTGPFKYQWQVAVGAGGFANIATANATYTGATSSTLTIPSVTTAIYSNRYRVVVKNGGNCTNSTVAFAQIGLPVTLPVTVESFTADKQETSAKLLWTVASSFTVPFYTVQRSFDGLSFIDAGTVKSERGKTAYGFVDPAPGPGTVQYRLKMADADGVLWYSSIARLTWELGASRFELRPSVAAGGLVNLYTATDNSETLALTVNDVMGRLLWSKSVKLEKGAHYTPLDVSQLTRGIYFVHLTGIDGLSKTLSFVRN